MILVCDAGGGTTDVNVLKLVSAPGEPTVYEPLGFVEGKSPVYHFSFMSNLSQGNLSGQSSSMSASRNSYAPNSSPSGTLSRRQ